MKVLVIPDVHLKPYMFQRAAELMRQGVADRVVCLMDIPDDWNQQYIIPLYEETFDSAISFAKEFPATLWCMGNHDLSYVWQQPESGYSGLASITVQKKLIDLKATLPEGNYLKYIHKIDNVVFCHGGIRDSFVKEHVSDSEYDDPDEGIEVINIVSQVHEAYSSAVRVFDTQIPMSVRAAEISAEGSSLYQYDPKGKAASAYLALVDDILGKERANNG